MKVSLWQSKIAFQEKYYKQWESLFKCQILERYYEGFQWNLNAANYSPYVLNVVYSTIKIKLANIIFQRPEFIIDPKPQFMDWNEEEAILKAQLKQDTLNTVIGNPRVNFVHNLRLAALDSFFRFGVIEVGYAADWLNPNKIPNTGENKDVAQEELPFNERVFFNHIRASRFRVAAGDSTTLTNAEWCGYYEYRLRSDLEKIKGIKLPKGFKAKYYVSDFNDIASAYGVDKGSPEMLTLLGRGEVCKVWKIWNNYEKTQCVYIDNYFDEPIYEKTFERVPFSTVRWDFRAPSREDESSSGWYPIPPVFQWLSSQDEINRGREQLRNYRRRFTRKWYYVKGGVEPTELEKLKTEEDGLAIEVKRADAIGTIQNPEIGLSIQESFGISKSDINLITGTSSQARAQSDRQTATETKAIQLREQIRESVEQLDFSDFVISCGREGLLQLKERFSERIWVKLNLDPGEDFLAELTEKRQTWKLISVEDLEDGYDEEISLNVINASPAKMAEEETKYLKFLSLMNQFPQIALSPALIRETAYRVGYRNERVIREFQKTALLSMLGQAAQAAGGSQQMLGAMKGMSPVAQGMLGNSQPPATEDTDAQLQSQLS